MQPSYYMLRYGELALKGRNRDRFEKHLVNIVKPRIKHLDGHVERRHKRLLVFCKAEPQELRKALSTVFGVVGISPIWETNHNPENIVNLAWRLAEPHKGSDKRFAIKVKRAFKQYPMNSMEMQKHVADQLLSRGLDLKVDLKKPDLKLSISLDFKNTTVHLETWPGLGGLPVDDDTLHGLLLSGGIDSPVAGNLIQKRGGRLTAIYFHTPPFTVEAAKDKVIELASVLARYQNGLDLHVVNFTEAMKAIRATCTESYTILLSRRLMMKVATQLMTRHGGQSLVTGESLGQVASQTIENMTAVNYGVPLPVLRPVIGMDKREIIAMSQKIQAYDISIRPEQDCCSLFSPDEPVTRAKLDLVLKEESKLDAEALVAGALEEVETIHLDESHAS